MTIAKFFLFVIFPGLSCVFFSGCQFAGNAPGPSASESSYGAPRINGRIKSSEIRESSGIAASRCQSNVLWTHNVSGDDAFIYALNFAGASLGTWKVTNAKNMDWEDIAAYKDKAGICYLYIGEIGNNKLKRPEHRVYRVREPIVVPANADSTRKDPLPTSPADELQFKYPDFDQDAETLLVHPATAMIYVITKRVSGPAGVYRVRPEFGSAETQRAEAVVEISVPAIPNGFLTGGDISPDGRRLILCDYTQGYEFVLPVDSSNFDDIWAQSAVKIDLGERKVGEAVCYSVDGTSIFATSERENSPLIEVQTKK